MNRILYFVLKSFLFRSFVHACFSPETIKAIEWDIVRFHARIINRPNEKLFPPCDKLHLGCGSRIVDGWLNVDVTGSKFNIDLACGHLPWKDNVFKAAVGQHIIEHFHIETELIPLLKDLRRVLKPGGELWLSCPDIAKICRSYLERGMIDLIEGRKARFPEFELSNMPPSQMVNDLFHQAGEHKNLFDFDLLRWALEEAGFSEIQEVEEDDLLTRFPKFPFRGDKDHTLYVKTSNKLTSFP